jgi:membrane-bound serine protease (ClpP class)
MKPRPLWSLVWLLAACGSSVRPLSDKTQEPQPVQAVVVRLGAHLGVPELALCHRVLRESASGGVQSVVFELDSAGEAMTDSPADLEALLDRIQQMQAEHKPPETVAWVKGTVTANGAHLALMCDKLFMAPGSHLGLVAPLPDGWKELLGQSDDNSERKRLKQFRQELRQRLEQRRNKYSADVLRLCEGMADPTLQLVRATVRENGVESQRILEINEEKDLAKAGTVIVARTPLPQPVDLSDREAEDFGLSLGKIQSLEQLVTDQLRLPREAVGEAVPNWSEHMVGWLQLMQPALLVLGFVLLLLEVKTPGFGLPGTLGVLLLGLAMFYSYLVGLAEVTEILLFFLGIAAIAIEILVLPGTIVFGAVGFLALVFSLILSRQSFVIPSTATQEEILLQNLLNLTLMLVLVIVVAAVLWRVLPRVPVLRTIFLAPPDQPASGSSTSTMGVSAAQKALVGRVGVAATLLRPAGVLDLEGEPVDVITRGEFIEAGTALRVVAVEGNRVIVESAADRRAGERGSVGFILLLVVLGLALLVAEVMFVSFGLIAVLSGVALVSAVFLAFQEGTGFGWSVLVADAICAPVVLFFAFRLLPKTPFGRKIMLEAPAHGEVVPPGELAALLHKEGVALSPLRPAGFARIDGKRVDVVTRGEMLDKDCPVRVVEVQGNRVVVAHLLRSGTAATNRS